VSVLLDTSVVIDILRAFPPALAYARNLTEPPVCSEVTRVEILQGVRHGEEIRTERMFQTLRWVALDEPIARRAGDMGRLYRGSHSGVGTSDLIIAATAQEQGLALATGNVKHFPMFPGLNAPYGL